MRFGCRNREEFMLIFMFSPLSCVVPEGEFAQVDGPFEGIDGVCADPAVEEREVEEECEEDDFSHFRPP
uniref:Uncharacterized protein n=1 Tax=viral metagenome TaxID=1070528 RepID=A0A6H1ZN57_9ZZZZ